MGQAVKFYLSDFLNTGDNFHLARTTITSEKDLKMHFHDYPEIFWIKEGTGIHLINDHKIAIQPGSLWMIRPGDRHTFRMHSREKGLVVTNIAFNEQELELYKKRYFNDVSSYFWTRDELPYHCILDKDQLNDLSNLADKFLVDERKYLHFDHIMLHIFEILLAVNDNASSIPHWLNHALKTYNSPQSFNSGVSGFVALTGKSADHVNRVVKTIFKQTITETINKIKLEFASRQLIYTNTPIKIICSECGFDSVTYFHRLFKYAYGVTPREYRDKNHKIF